jgi:hypothetical protein
MTIPTKINQTIDFIRTNSDRIAKITAFILAISFIILFIVLSLKRVFYPFEVEWMEGSFIRHAARIFNGEQLFVKPSIYFVNWLYQPLYYYFVAFAMKWAGFSCTAGRIVTFASTMTTALLVYAAVFRLVRSHYYSFLGAGLFLACYGLTDLCFDIVRPDPLFVTLTIASVVVLIYSQRPLAIVFSAILISLAIFTKQQAFYYVVPLAAWLFFQKRSSAFIYLTVVIICFAIGTYLFYQANGEWYFYYIYKVSGAKSGGLNYLRATFVFSSFIFSGWAVASLSTIVGYLILRKQGQSFLRSTSGLLLFTLLAAVFHMAIHLTDLISGRNSAMPFAALLAIAFPVIIIQIRPYISVKYQSALLWLIVFQLLGSLYTPKRLPFGVVSSSDHQATARFVDSLKTINGDVLLWNNSIAAEFAGKKSFANYLAVADIAAVGDRLSTQFKKDWQATFDTGLYSAIIIDDVTYNNMDSIPNYTFSHFINTGSECYKTFFGSVPSYPRYVLVPKKEK